MHRETLNFTGIRSGFYDSQFVYNKSIVISPERKVELYEMEYFPQSGGVSVINGKAEPIVKGNILFAAPGDSRHSVLPFKAYYVHWRTGNEKLKHMLKNLPHISRMGEDAVRMEALFRQIIRSYNSEEPYCQVYLEAKILDLIFWIASRKEAQEDSRVYSPVVLKALEYIGRNYKEDIQLKDIAEAVGLTPVYFHNLFRSAVGKTPREYLQERRLEAAKELLAGSDMSLVNVAAECGFSSQAYFTAVFKRNCGATPLAYRQEAFTKYQL